MSWNFRNLSKHYRFYLLWILGYLVWCLILGGKAALNIRLIGKLEKTDCVLESLEYYNGFKILADGDSAWTLKYKYQYEGREYTSDRFSVLEKHLVGNAITKLEYPVGMKTFCYVNPANPDQAFLDVKWNYQDVICLMFLPLILFVLGVISFVHWRFWGDGP